MALPTNSSLAKKHGCNPVSSNCVVWQGPDLDCIGLCHGDTVSDVIAKMAQILCDLIDQLDISNFDFTCLLTNGVVQPLNIQELIQLIIDQLCNTNTEVIDSDDIEIGGKSGECPENCIILIPAWAQYTDSLGNVIKSMPIAEYAETSANKITTLISDIAANTALATQNALDITTLDSRVTTVEGDYVTTGDLQYTVDTSIDPSGTPEFIPTALKEIEDTFVSQRTSVGYNAELLNSILQGTAFNNEDRLGSIGNMATLPGWQASGSTLASSLMNMWVAYADMRQAVSDIKENCCVTGCGSIYYNFRSTVDTTSGALTIYLDGSTGVEGFRDCDTSGSVYTVVDSDGNSTSGRVEIIDTINDPSGSLVSLASTPVDYSLDLIVTIHPCLHNSDLNTTCESVLSYNIYAANNCPSLTIIPSVYEMDYSFPVTAGYDYIVQLFEGVSSVVIESATFNTPNPPALVVNGTFGSVTPLTENTNYRIRVILQNADGTQITCPDDTVATLPETCLAATALSTAIVIIP
mgnify:CR=1 FL=1|tara:strand:- start:7413 stop:8978 length:1566 start_codon:yes stop_codon:yes gene_type:complete